MGRVDDAVGIRPSGQFGPSRLPTRDLIQGPRQIEVRCALGVQREIPHIVRAVVADELTGLLADFHEQYCNRRHVGGMRGTHMHTTEHGGLWITLSTLLHTVRPLILR